MTDSTLTPWRVIGTDGDETGVARWSADHDVLVQVTHGRVILNISGRYPTSLHVPVEVIAEAARCCLRAGLLTAEELVPVSDSERAASDRLHDALAQLPEDELEQILSERGL